MFTDFTFSRRDWQGPGEGPQLPSPPPHPRSRVPNVSPWTICLKDLCGGRPPISAQAGWLPAGLGSSARGRSRSRTGEIGLPGADGGACRGSSSFRVGGGASTRLPAEEGLAGPRLLLRLKLAAVVVGAPAGCTRDGFALLSCVETVWLLLVADYPKGARDAKPPSPPVYIAHPPPVL